jgi:hypothetical protein
MLQALIQRNILQAKILMVDKNGEPLYYANYNMPSSSNHFGPMVFHHKLKLFYDTLIVYGCSKYEELEVKPRRVTQSHYVNG